MLTDEGQMAAARIMHEASEKAHNAATTIQESVHRLALMAEPGYGGTVLRLIELLEQRETNEDEVEKLRQAIGLMTTAKPDLVMDASDPVSMARAVCAEVEQLRKQAAQRHEDYKIQVNAIVALKDKNAGKYLVMRRVLKLLDEAHAALVEEMS